MSLQTDGVTSNQWAFAGNSLATAGGARTVCFEFSFSALPASGGASYSILTAFGSSTQLGLLLQGDGKLSVITDTFASPSALGTSTLAINTRYSVALVVSAGTLSGGLWTVDLKVYLNGNLEIHVSAFTYPDGAHTNFYMGGSNNSDSVFKKLAAKFSAFKLWLTTLTGSQVSAERAHYGPQAAGCIAAYPMFGDLKSWANIPVPPDGYTYRDVIDAGSNGTPVFGTELPSMLALDAVGIVVDGSSSAYVIPSLVNASDIVTMMAWYVPQNSRQAGTNSILTIGKSGVATQPQLYHDSHSPITTVSLKLVSNGDDQVCNIFVPAATPLHLAVTYAAGVANVYASGVLAFTHTYTPTSDTGLGLYLMSSQNNEYGQRYDALSFVRLWKGAALTASEITAEKNSKTAVKTASLLLDCDCQGRLSDQSGHSHPITVQSGSVRYVFSGPTFSNSPFTPVTGTTVPKKFLGGNSAGFTSVPGTCVNTSV